MVKKTAAAFVFVTLLAFPIGSYANDPSSPSGVTDPYATTNYTAAFDPKVLKEFSDVLNQEHVPNFDALEVPVGLWTQVCNGFSRFNCLRHLQGVPEGAQLLVDEAPHPEMTFQHYRARKTEMGQALLAQLLKEKSRSSWRPAGQAGLGLIPDFIVASLGFSAASVLPPAQQALALWPLMQFFYGMSKVMQVTATSIYTKLFPVNDPLFDLEAEFAVKLPYATHQERKLITDSFASERASHRYNTDDLKIRIGLIKPKNLRESEFPEFDHAGHAPIDPSPHGQWEDPILNHIQQYFSHYKNSEVARDKIAAAVRGYVKKLKEGKDQTAYTILLQGSFGTGKSHFAKSLATFLSQELDDVLPGKFPMKLVSYTSKDDLLGNEQRPGAILTALSRIKREYGIIFLDEGNLNGLDTVAKLLLDDAGTDYPYPFLKGGSRSLKNYLVIVCSNDELKDRAIDSRIFRVDYPEPKQELVRSIVKGLVENALPEGTSPETIDWYFYRNSIQKLITDSAHLRLRNAVLEKVANIQYKLIEKQRLDREKEHNEHLDRIKSQFHALLHHQYANTYRIAPVTALIASEDFWLKPEAERLRLVDDLMQKTGGWLEKMQKTGVPSERQKTE